MIRQRPTAAVGCPLDFTCVLQLETAVRIAAAYRLQGTVQSGVAVAARFDAAVKLEVSVGTETRLRIDDGGAPEILDLRLDTAVVRMGEIGLEIAQLQRDRTHHRGFLPAYAGLRRGEMPDLSKKC